MVNKLGAICAVYSCKNYKQQKGVSKSFFRMPKNRALLKTWIAACSRPDLDELLNCVDPDYFYRTCVVCSDHFRKECYKNKNLFSQGLLPGAIPTEKLYNVEPSSPSTVQEQIDQIDVKEVKIEEKRNEEVANVISLDESAFLMSKSRFQDLLEENKRLKQMINEYRVKLKYKANMILKYRKRNQVLEENMLKYKKSIGKAPISSVVHSQMKSVIRKRKNRRCKDNEDEIPLDLFFCSTTS